MPVAGWLAWMSQRISHPREGVCLGLPAVSEGALCLFSCRMAVLGLYKRNALSMGRRSPVSLSWSSWRAGVCRANKKLADAVFRRAPRRGSDENTDTKFISNSLFQTLSGRKPVSYPVEGRRFGKCRDQNNQKLPHTPAAETSSLPTTRRRRHQCTTTVLTKNSLLGRGLGDTSTSSVNRPNRELEANF